MVEPKASREFGGEEVRLALRNPGMQLEALRLPVTPVGMHYLLIHFDVPFVDEDSYELTVGGCVETPLRLSLAQIRARPAITMPVTMECAGNGRALLSPRPVSAPWHEEAVGCAEWTGTPVRPILEEAGLLDDAVEVVFTGHDRGVDRGVEQAYERSLPLDEALRDEVLLAYRMNGAPLPPQHGAPLRLVVPQWYGMASVKWLEGITAVDKPFDGVQQSQLYRYQQSPSEPGEPVTRQYPRALMAPPGIPDFLSRERRLEAGPVAVEGKAWSGFGPIERVEFSSDGGGSWEDAVLDEPLGPYAWTPWTFEWEARPGDHELRVRATDETGRTQPVEAEEAWNLGGYSVNAAQRVRVSVEISSA